MRGGGKRHLRLRQRPPIAHTCGQREGQFLRG